MANTDRPNDFFTRLAERALGLTPAAMPLLAPVYAPGPAFSEAPAVPFTEGGEWTPEAGLPQPPPGAPLPGRDEGRRSTDVKTGPGVSPAVSARSEVEPPTARGNAPRSGDEASVPFVSPVPPSTESFIPASAPKPVLPSQPSILSIQHAVQQDETHPDVEGDAAASSVQREGPPSVPVREPGRILVPLERLVEAPAGPQGGAVPPEEDRRARAGSPFQPAPIPASLLERGDLSLLPPQGRSEPRAAPGRSEPDSPAASLPQPTIRITIGRVEVRAVRPSRTSPPAPAPSPRPALSLDEYLKQRNEARR